MKTYIVLFISFIFIFIISITYMGMVSTLRVMEHIDISKEQQTLIKIRSDIQELYKDTDNKEDLQQISLKVDSLYAGYNRSLILKDYILNRSVIDLALVAVIGLIAGAVLWFGTLKLIIKPISRTIKELEKINENNWQGQITLTGPKEIIYLQKTLNRLIQNLIKYRDHIKQIERENIGSFITHKIKNSLTPIHLCAFNIKELTKGNEAAENNVNMIIEEINKTEQFISQFRTFFKAPVINKQPIELNTFFETISKKYSSVEFNRYNNDISISGDPTLLEEVLVNLIQNGIDASEKESDKIHISIEHKINPVIHIIDHGCGIEIENLNMVLSEYYTTKQKGMGIGLSFVSKVLDAHGFELIIDSTIGKGTDIRIICNE